MSDTRSPMSTPVYLALAEASLQLSLAMAVIAGPAETGQPELTDFTFRKAWESVQKAAQILADNATFEAAGTAIDELSRSEGGAA